MRTCTQIFGHYQKKCKIVYGRKEGLSFLLCGTFQDRNDSKIGTSRIKERFLFSLFRPLHCKVVCLTKERQGKPKVKLPTGAFRFRFRTQHWPGGGRGMVLTTYTHYVSCPPFVPSYIRYVLRGTCRSFHYYVISFLRGWLRVVPFVVLVEIFYPTPIGGIGAINGLREVQGAFM